MLIIVPPSETKAPTPAAGDPVELDALSFPELTPTRRRFVDALIEASGGPDAFERLRVGLSMLHDVAMNTHVLELPARPAHELYTGPLHAGLDIAGLSGGAAERANRDVVIVSALWGALRPTDRIPRYRLLAWASLSGIDRVDATWRAVLPDVLAEAAGPSGVIVDLRSRAYQAMGMPAGQAARTVTLRVAQGAAGQFIGDVIAKRVRGEAAHYLLESGAEPADPHALADVLGDRWPVRLESPERPGKPWTMTLSID